MNLGDLSDDFCLVCGKGVKKINGYWMHLELDSSHYPQPSQKQLKQFLVLDGGTDGLRLRWVRRVLVFNLIGVGIGYLIRVIVEAIL